MKSIFELDKLRDKLASENSIKKFKDTYRTPVNFKDLNTPIFWDEKMSRDREQTVSPIYKDKINIISEILIRLGGNILDIGMGNAFLEQRLSKSKNIKLYGMDISSYVINKAKKEFEGEYKIGDIKSIPFKTNLFDVVVALDVLEHIPSSQILAAYDEIVRVSKKKSKIVISVPLNENLEEMVKKGINPNGHMRVYTPNILKAELSLFGFKVVEEHYLFAFSKFYWAKKILMTLIGEKFRKPNLFIVVAENSYEY